MVASLTQAKSPKGKAKAKAKAKGAAKAKARNDKDKDEAKVNPKAKAKTKAKAKAKGTAKAAAKASCCNQLLQCAAACIFTHKATPRTRRNQKSEYGRAKDTFMDLFLGHTYIQMSFVFHGGCILCANTRCCFLNQVETVGAQSVMDGARDEARQRWFPLLINRKPYISL